MLALFRDMSYQGGLLIVQKDSDQLKQMFLQDAAVKWMLLIPLGGLLILCA